MNSLIKEQLLKLSISTGIVDGKVYKVADIPENSNKILFTNIKEDDKVTTDKLYHFVFEKYLVKPYVGFDFNIKWNNSVNIPLTYMYGKVVKELEKLYYIKCYGSNITSDYCHHCLKYIGDNFLCDACKQLYGIISKEDIKKITWEGWVPKKSIVFMEEIFDNKEL